jgi:hypothetical protein
MGTVTDALTGKPLSAVTVVNARTQIATATNEQGLYIIPANPGDVVAFSYMGYKTIRKPKPLSVILATMNITMEHTEYILDEFRLHPGLTRYQVDSAERATIYKIPLQRTHASIMSPASALAELFSQKAKRTYAFQKTFAEGEIEKFVDSRYSPTLVTKLTGLTGDSIGHFMYAYPMPYDFARTATDLELKMWIRSSYRDWQKKPLTDTTLVAKKQK